MYGWEDYGWDTSPPMEVDSMIFFPEDFVTVKIGMNLEIGGAAFGGTRISRVEYTIDDGNRINDFISIKDNILQMKENCDLVEDMRQ